MATGVLPGFVRAGAVVRLAGLVKRADLNGRYAGVLSPLPPSASPLSFARSGRIGLSLLFGDEGEEGEAVVRVRVRPANMRELTGRAADASVRAKAGEMLRSLLDRVVGLRWKRLSAVEQAEVRTLEETGRHLQKLRTGAADDRYECAHPGCSNASKTFQACGGCRSVRYCSSEHQKADWKRHKPRCLAERAAAVRCVPVLPEEYEKEPPAGTECPICMCGFDECSEAPYPILTGCGCNRNKTTRYHVECLLRGAATAVGSGRQSMYDAFCKCSVCKLPFSGPVEQLMRSAAQTSVGKAYAARTDAAAGVWWEPLRSDPDRFGALMVRLFAPYDRNRKRAAGMLREASDWLFEHAYDASASVLMKNEVLRSWLAWVEVHTSLESTPADEKARLRSEVEEHMFAFAEEDPKMVLLPEFCQTMMWLEFSAGRFDEGVTCGRAGIKMFLMAGRIDDARRLQRELALHIFSVVDQLWFDGADDVRAWAARSRARPDDVLLASVVRQLHPATEDLEAAATHYAKTYDAGTHPDYAEVQACCCRHANLLCSIAAAVDAAA